MRALPQQNTQNLAQSIYRELLAGLSGALVGAPQAMVTRQKQAKIVRVAMAYVQERRVRDTALRFDVVAVTCLPGTAPEVVHVPAAFDATPQFRY